MPNQRRATWIIVVFVALQVSVPTMGAIMRMTGVWDYARYSWHMYSTTP